MNADDWGYDRVTTRAIQFVRETDSGIGSSHSTIAAAGSSRGMAIAGAAEYFARMSPHAPHAAGSDWSAGNGAWPHLGQDA